MDWTKKSMKARIKVTLIASIVVCSAFYWMNLDQLAAVMLLVILLQLIFYVFVSDETDTGFIEVSEDNKETLEKLGKRIYRPKHVLLETIFNHTDKIEPGKIPGLCSLVDVLVHGKYVTVEEVKYFEHYIYCYAPWKDPSYRVGYVWSPGYNEPRRKWLRERIKIEREKWDRHNQT